MENFRITKDNYKGYLELYKLRNNIEKYEKNPYTMIKEYIKLSIPDIIIFAIPMCLWSSTFISIITAILFPIIAGIDVYKRYEKKQIKNYKLKEKYPYIDIKIKSALLKKELEAVGIVRYEKRQGIPTIIIEENIYKNLQSESLENEKIHDYQINSDISIPDEQLEKVKVLVRK